MSNNKSRLGQFTKRQIFESMYADQQQSTTMLNRMLVALSLASNISPEDLAKCFNDAEGVQTFVDKFNNTLRASQQAPLVSNNESSPQE